MSRDIRWTYAFYFSKYKNELRWVISHSHDKDNNTYMRFLNKWQNNGNT